MKPAKFSSRRSLLLLLGTAACLLLCAGIAKAQEQYPKPLIHTPTDHPADHILLIVVDGLHAFDLAWWTTAHPDSALAALARRGVAYTNARTPVADRAAGTLALVTGGTPISTGITGVHGFDRTLSPPGSACKYTGAALDLDSPSPPLDPHASCTPILPHQLLRDNTMFEVVHQKIGPTAWASDSAAITDLLRGPSGEGLDCTAAAHDDASTVAAVREWLDPHSSASCLKRVPALLGVNLTAISHADRDPAAGYIDVAGTPSPRLIEAFRSTDASIAALVTSLKAQHLYDSTWIVVTASRAFPLAARPRRSIPLSTITRAAKVAVAYSNGGTAAQLWLAVSNQTSAAIKNLSAQAAALGIARIAATTSLALTANSPAADPRTPDIVLQAEPGTTWTTPGNARSGPGAESDAETHVALLISGAQLTGRFDSTPVPTTQLAPLLLRALGMEKFDLNALHHEHSPALPGIF